MDKITKTEFLKLFKNKTKYGNKKTDLGRGTFDSKIEAKYDRDCFMRLKAKEIKDYAVQVPIPLTVNKIHIADYIMDFVIRHLDDSYEFVETKGFETKDWKLKWKLLNALYGQTHKITLEK